MMIIAEWHLFCHLNQWGDCRARFLLPWYRNTLDAEESINVAAVFQLIITIGIAKKKNSHLNISP